MSDGARVEISMPDINCGGCADRVRGALGSLRGLSARAVLPVSHAALAEARVAPGPDLLAEAAAARGALATHPVVVSAHAASFALLNPMRAEAAPSIAALRVLGLRTALIQGGPSGAVRALRLSPTVMRDICQIMLLASACNIALISVAMGAFLPFGGSALSPMLGADAMALSSVFVVGNALRLRRAG